MKTNMIICCFVLVALLLAHGDEGGQPRMIGHLVDTKKEVSSAAYIVIGKFTKVKEGGAVSMEGTAYHGRFTILKDLKGNVTGDIEVGFSLIQGPSDTEIEPNVNDVYIAVLVDRHQIQQLLPSTNGNIVKIKQLIAETEKKGAQE